MDSSSCPKWISSGFPSLKVSAGGSFLNHFSIFSIIRAVPEVLPFLFFRQKVIQRGAIIRFGVVSKQLSEQKEACNPKDDDQRTKQGEPVLAVSGCDHENDQSRS